MPAGRAARVEDDRPGALFLEPAVNFPNQLPALLSFGLVVVTPARAFLVGVRMTGNVPAVTAGVFFGELLVGLVDSRGSGVLHAHHVLPPRYLRTPRRPCSPAVWF